VRMFSRAPIVLRVALMVAVGAFVLLVAIIPAAPAAAADGDTLINLAGGIAQPVTATVTTGTRVVWVNRQLEGSLTITSDTGAFDTGMLMPGQSYFYVFNQPGIYLYHAPQSSGVRGRIVVNPPPPPVIVSIPQPPPSRVMQSEVNIPQSQVGSVSQVPGPAAPPVYLPLASAPPAPVRQTVPTYGYYYGYAIPGAVQPAFPPRTGGGGLASSYSNEDDQGGS